MNKPPVPLVERIKTGAIGLAIGLAIGAAGAGYVWLSSAQEVRELKEMTAKDLADAQEEAETLQRTIAAEREHASVLAARVEIARARVHVDEMNYGLVVQRLQVAAQRLEGIPNAVDVAQRLGNVQVDPQSPESARRAIHALAGEVDALIVR
jgi:phage FluMu protein gp41